MTGMQKLLHYMLKEIIVKDEQKNRDTVTYALCMHTLKDVNPNEIDTTKTTLKCHDDKRWYIGVTTKNGVEMIAPLNKKYASENIVLKMGVAGS